MSPDDTAPPEAAPTIPAPPPEHIPEPSPAAAHAPRHRVLPTLLALTAAIAGESGVDFDLANPSLDEP